MAQVNMPQTSQAPKEDALGTLVKGLQIAQGIYGIKADMAMLNKYDQEEQARQKNLDAETRRAGGQYNPNEILGLSEKYNVSRSNNPQDANFDPNAMQITDASSGSPLYLSTKRDLQKFTSTDKAGHKVTKFAYATPGLEVQDYQEPKEFETTGPDGKPQITLKVPTAGMTIDKYVAPVMTDQRDPLTGQPIQKFETPVAGKSFGSSKGVLTSSEFGTKAQEEGNKLYDNSKPFRDTIDASSDVLNLSAEAVNGNKANEIAASAMFQKLASEAMAGKRIPEQLVGRFETPQQLSEYFSNKASLAANGQLDPALLKDAQATAVAMAETSKEQLKQLVDTTVHRFTLNFNGAYGANAASPETLQKNLDDNYIRLTGVLKNNAAHESNNPPGPKFKEGDTRVINSVTMVRDKKGNWIPQNTAQAQTPIPIGSEASAGGVNGRLP